MMKVQQKISGTFRSTQGAVSFCRIRGYISTVKKNKLSVIDAIAQGATYNIQVIKPVINCTKCSYNGPIEFFEKLHFFLPVIKCPRCDETDVEIVGGRECCVRKINIS